MESREIQTQRSGISDSQDSRSVDELSNVTALYVRKRRRVLRRVDSEEASSMSCLELVFGYLRPKDLARAACVCRSWKKSSYNDALWEEICKRKWPSTRTEAATDSIRNGGGFRKFYRRRIIGPAKPHMPTFELDDVTFFLDVTLFGHIVISHAFNYAGGCARIEYGDGFVDEKAIFPPVHAFDLEDFRRMLEVNLCAVRVSDSKGVSLLKSPPARCGQGFVEVETGESLKALKINFHTALGGQLSHVFYGMLNVGLSFPVVPRAVSEGEQICFGGIRDGRSEGSKLLRTGGMVMEISALKDRLGGTVKVHVAGDEFRMLLSSLNWD